MQNAVFNPHEQGLLLGELANMTGVADRKYFIETAIGAHEESVPVFLRVRAQLMNLYQDKTNSVVSLISANGIPLMLMFNTGFKPVLFFSCFNCLFI